MHLRLVTANALAGVLLGLSCSNGASSGATSTPSAPSASADLPVSASSAPGVNETSTTLQTEIADSAGSSSSLRDETSTQSPLESSSDATTAPTLSESPTESTRSETSESAPTEAECDIDVTATLSEQIATVGILTFTTDLGEVDDGHVEFGLDTTYGQQAPLDTAVEAPRALLLGMTATTEYHYRVVIQSGNRVCRSEDHVLTTGAAPSDLPIPSLKTSTESDVTPGYLVTSAQATGGNGGGYYIMIYNHRGQPVWWYRSVIGGLVTRAKLSWDGKFIYGRDGNPSARSGGQVVRIAIDGSTEESLTADTGHHDLAVTPDNGVLFLVGGGGDGCSRIEKWSATDEVSDFYDLRDAFGDAFKSGNDPCHCNSIHYNPADASITVSCLMQNAYVKLSEEAELQWVLGGNNDQSHFTGDVAWERQHGHHMLASNRILFLNNNGGGDSTSQSSLAVELELDVENKTAQRVWEYDGGEVTQTLGDVQRLANGNTLVTYCNAGIMHEVDADKQLVQSWQFSNGVGYADHRETLYGAPVRP